MKRPRVQSAIKALLLISMGLFLYSRFTNGLLGYYINERFIGFTLIAVMGLMLVGLSYPFGNNQSDAEHIHPEDMHDGKDDHGKDDHGKDDHGKDAHHVHEHHSHEHNLAWSGVLIVAIPILLGLFVSPRPLGVAALENRDINFSTTNGFVSARAEKASTRSKETWHILDWWRAFQSASDPSQSLVGEEANIIGFVYHDQRFGDGYFMTTRFALSCCVADAAVVGLLVEWPEAATLLDDQWVEIRGVFAPSRMDNWSMPLLVATNVLPVEIPEQPYLYR